MQLKYHCGSNSLQQRIYTLHAPLCLIKEVMTVERRTVEARTVKMRTVKARTTEVRTVEAQRGI